MSTTDKLIEKVEDYQRGCTITFQDIEKYLMIYGFKQKPRKGTSHVIFTHSSLKRPFVVPKHGNDIKIIYIKKAVELVQVIKDEKGD